MAKAGLAHLHVLTDFDETLTTAFVDGKKHESIISMLRKEKFLTPDYPAKAQALYEKYRPYEDDLSLPREEKKRLMHEWWQKHFDLLIASGLKRQDIEKALDLGAVRLREGTGELFSLLKNDNVPVVIMSSSGLGGDAIKYFLQKHGLMHDNVSVVSNVFEWSDDGRALSVRQPIIHSLNKDETAMAGLEFYKEIESRLNVLLMGNSPDDIDMLNGVEHENVIKVGFLNDNVEKFRALFAEKFDVVITNDGPMTEITDLVKEIV